MPDQRRARRRARGRRAVILSDLGREPSEVATKLSGLGTDAEAARALLAPLHLAVVPFDEPAGFATGALRMATRGSGLSLGDRACLALAASRGATALTTDKAWADAGERVGVAVEMLR